MVSVSTHLRSLACILLDSTLRHLYQYSQCTSPKSHRLCHTDHLQGPSSSVSTFSLWLKSEHYSISLINIIPTSQLAIQLVTTVTFSIFSDYWRNRPAVMSFSTFWGLLTTAILAAWTVPIGLKWFAFEMYRAAVPYGPLSMSWAK